MLDYLALVLLLLPFAYILAVMATAAELRQQGDWDVDNPTDEDCEAFAAQINDGI